MTSDMGGLYRIAAAIDGPERMKLDREVWRERADLERQRLDLDRRALALREACETVRFDFTRSEDAPPVHERALAVARIYYDYLAQPQDTDVQP
jgi:hypothetical protein